MAPLSILDAALARAVLAAAGSTERYPTLPVKAIRAHVLDRRQGGVTQAPTLHHREPCSPADDPLAKLAKLLGGPRWEEIVTKLHELAENAGALPPSERRAASDTVEVGDLRVETHAHRVLVAGSEVALTTLEFRLLVTLLDRRDRVQSRGVLLNDVWELPSTSKTRTVDTHVRRLRDKLGATGEFIQTVRGVGYRFSDRLAIQHPDGRCKSHRNVRSGAHDHRSSSAKKFEKDGRDGRAAVPALFLAK
jgi:DNA-binding response OmpR family regulator